MRHLWSSYTYAHVHVDSPGFKVLPHIARPPPVTVYEVGPLADCDLGEVQDVQHSAGSRVDHGDPIAESRTNHTYVHVRRRRGAFFVLHTLVARRNSHGETYTRINTKDWNRRANLSSVKWRKHLP